MSYIFSDNPTLISSKITSLIKNQKKRLTLERKRSCKLLTHFLLIYVPRERICWA